MSKRWVQKNILIFGMLSLISSPPVSSASTKVIIIGQDILKEIFVGSHFILKNSDTLRLNGIILIKGADYRFQPLKKSFKLNRDEISASDTLEVTYSPLAFSLKLNYGNKIETFAQSKQRILPKLKLPNEESRNQEQETIKLSGSKTFRFSNNSQSSSSFGQSLNLNISGKLAENVTISGAITDKGYSPSYGTATSRINELDRIRIKIASPVFSVNLGDIEFNKSRSLSQYSQSKGLSGLSLNYKTTNVKTSLTVARPKGRFESLSIFGEDNKQGPYQLNLQSINKSVVPGSETVWLDGQKLSRGKNNDYEIDYAIGEITFGPSIPIYSRSRIAVDFELPATSYRGEFIDVSNQFNFFDSSLKLSFSWQREGDDKNDFLIGILSEADQKIISNSGGDTLLAVRSGVIADSSGNYILMSDSLPDSIYIFVDTPNGDYRINFRFVGAGGGDYFFLGGEEYLFAGANQGDYLPIVKLPIPTRRDQFISQLSLSNKIIGVLKADFSVSNNDLNLFSDLDKQNSGRYYKISNTKEWKTDSYKLNLILNSRVQEKEFSSSVRINNSDFAYKFNLPNLFKENLDEALHSGRTSLAYSHKLRLESEFSYLKQENRFDSKYILINTDYFISKRLVVNLNFQNVDSYLNDSLKKRGDGQVRKYGAEIKLPLGKLSKKTTAGLSLEKSIRTNSYYSNRQGQRYQKSEVYFKVNNEKISYQFINDDSLNIFWNDNLERTTYSFSTARKLKQVSIDAQLLYQKLKREESTENSFLGRVQYGYNNSVKNIFINGLYNLNTENKNPRGIRYIEVNRGEGNFIFDNGEYRPDPDGNFIKVDELLSKSEKVQNGEKSFRFNKKWDKLLLRYNFNVSEELLESGKRTLLWIVPFYSQSKEPYLFYLRKNNLDVRIFPFKNSYFINLTAREIIEKRFLNKVRVNKSDRVVKIKLNESSGDFYFAQSFETFLYDRDSYFSLGGKITGFEIGLSISINKNKSEFILRTNYRQAKSDNKAQSEIYNLILENNYRSKKRGKLSSSLELYTQQLNGNISSLSYKLIDNKTGTKGAIWKLSANYNIDKLYRLKFSLSGKHSNQRKPLVVLRGEFVARF